MTKSNIFLLFTGDICYPSGGWLDFSGSYTDCAEAVMAGKEYVFNNEFSWYHVVDYESNKIVCKGM